MDTKLLYLFICLYFFPLIGNTQIDATIQTYIDKAAPFYDKNEYVEALVFLEKALEEEEIQNVAPNTLATLYHKLAVSYFYLDKLIESVSFIDKATELRLKHLGKYNKYTLKSRYMQAGIRGWVGEYETALGSYKQLIQDLYKCPEHSIAVRDSLLADHYHEIASVYLRLGNFPQALIYLKKTERYFLKKYNTINPDILTLNNRLAWVHSKTGQNEEAIQLYENNINYLEQKNERTEALAITYESLALIYQSLKEYKQARKTIDKALEIYRKLNLPSFTINYLSNSISINAYLQRYEAGVKDYEEGYQLIQDNFGNSYPYLLADLHTYRGRLERLHGYSTTAIGYYQKALQAHDPSFQAQDIYDNPMLTNTAIQTKYRLLKPLEGKAKALVQLYEQENKITHLEAALQTYQTLDTLITNMRLEYLLGDSKFLLLQKTRPVYEQSVETALQLYELSGDENYLEIAYNFNAKNKAIVLFDGWQEASAKQIARIPSSLVQQEKYLKKRIYKLEVKVVELEREQQAMQSELYQDSLFAARLAYEQLIAQFETEYPSYYQLKYAFTKSPTIEQVKSSLAADELLVEYFVGEDNIYTFTFTNKQFKYYKTNKPTDFQETVVRFQQANATYDSNNKKQFRQDAHQIYQWTLQQIRENYGNANITQLSIIPDDILTQLGFEALITTPSENLTSRPNYFLYDYPIRYIHSSQFLVTPPVIYNQADQIFAGFGIEYDPYTLEGIKHKEIAFYDEAATMRALGQLTYSDDEALLIADMLNGQTWLNEAATKAEFLEHAPHFQILHLAMHGAVDVQQPLNSALIFTRTEDSTDFLLKAADIYALTLDADMVVLSACNTGTGQVQKGEGIRTLARAFQYAGSQNLVASLWNASDRATKEIMESFYTNLENGLPKHRALQQAKQQYLQKASPEYSHPAYWANLVTIGNVDAIPFPRRFSPWGPILVITALASILLWKSYI